MAIKNMKATARAKSGKGAARELRRQGNIPAVIYGGGEAPMPITLDYKTTHKLIFAGRFLTTLFEIDVDGTKVRAIPRDYQMDPVKDLPVHVDFLRLKEGQKIKVEVPVHVVNQDASPGVKRGGTVNIVLHAIEMLVPAESIPESIEVDLKGVELNHSIHISSIKLPEGCKPVDKDDFTVVTVVPPSGMKEEVSGSSAAEAAPAASAKK
jgi:large subunit ribosomal protein L25